MKTNTTQTAAPMAELAATLGPFCVKRDGLYGIVVDRGEGERPIRLAPHTSDDVGDDWPKTTSFADWSDLAANGWVVD